MKVPFATVRPILVAVPVVLLVRLLTMNQRSFFGANRAPLVATRSSLPAIPASLRYEFVPETSAHACTDNKDKGVPPKELLEFLSLRIVTTELVNLFGDLCGGTYLEMSDGRTDSNTFTFDQLRWKGVVIDASPQNYVKLIKMNGPDEVVTVHVAVCKEAEHIKDMEPVKCKRLADLMAEHAPQQTFYDFFSLDA